MGAVPTTGRELRPTSDTIDGLIGRERETAALEDALAVVRGGDRHVVLLRGDPGVGKTRLLDALCGRARATGVRVMASRADEFDKRVPLAPITLALRPGLRSEDGPRTRPAASRLLELLSSGSRLALADRRPAELLTLLAEVLHDWADRAPLLLAIDDVHSADADSFDALGFLGRHVDARLLIAMTTRRHAPDVDVVAASALERIVSASPSTVIDVEPLGADEHAALIAAHCGATPSRELASRIWEGTRGNPFYTVELLRSLQEQELLIRDERGELAATADTSMSASGSVSVLRRVASLGDDAVVVSQTVAVLPTVDVSDLPWVVEITGLDETAVEAAFDRLVQAGVLASADDGYAFAHPIVRDTIYEQLGPADRSRLHRSVADLRIAQRELGRNVRVADIARHLRLAGTVDATTSQVFAAAGDEAADQAPRGAVEWYRDALAMMPADAPNRGAVLSRLARALHLSSQHGEAADAARQALALLPAGPTFARTVELLFVSLQRDGRFADALELVDEYLGEEMLTPRVVAQRGQLLLWLDRLPEAEASLERAAEMAGDTRDSLVDGARLNMYLTTGRTAEAHEVSKRLETTVRETQGLRATGSLVALASAAAYNGEPREAAAWLAQLDDAHVLPGTIVVARVHERFMAGAWDDVLAFTEQAEVAGECDPALRPLLLSTTAHVLAERGELAAARRVIDEIGAAPVFRSTTLAACAHVHLMAGDLDQARVEAGRAMRHQLAIGRIGDIARSASLLVDIELAAGRRHAAQRVVDQLRTAQPATPSARERMLTALAVAAAHDDVDSARVAATLADEHGFEFERARALVVAGTLDSDADALVEAVHVFRRLRVPGRERDVALLLRGLGRRLPRAERSDSGLTASERRLAELVSWGLTNRQIAAELHLSHKTVEVYLSRLYRKVGCASRVELAIAVRSGHV